MANINNEYQDFVSSLKSSGIVLDPKVQEGFDKAVTEASKGKIADLRGSIADPTSGDGQVDVPGEIYKQTMADGKVTQEELKVMREFREFTHAMEEHNQVTAYTNSPNGIKLGSEDDLNINISETLDDQSRFLLRGLENRARWQEGDERTKKMDEGGPNRLAEGC
jgi:hypothetical protein